MNPFADPYTFARSPEGVWIRENAHRFGVVATYQADRVAQHQYQPEPWHLRFVDVEAADARRACNLNTEELLNHRYQIGALPDFPAMDLVYDRMRQLGYPVCMMP